MLHWFLHCHSDQVVRILQMNNRQISGSKVETTFGIMYLIVCRRCTRMVLTYSSTKLYIQNLLNRSRKILSFGISPNRKVICNEVFLTT